MKKRVISFALAVTLCFALCGCSSLFKKDYLSVTKYTDETHQSNNGDAISVANYDELRQAVISMINSHSTEEKLKFTDYGESLQSDLAQVGWAVKADTALGSYAVDYISYDLNPIAGYYEAIVYITYRHSQSELREIRYASSKAELPQKIAPALDKLGKNVAIRITSSTITQDEALLALERAYTGNPAGCVVAPTATVKIHPESGTQRIIEYELNYGKSMSELKKLKAALEEKIAALTSSLPTNTPAHFALAAYNALAQACTYDPDTKLRDNRPELENSLGETAYGALCEGVADSRGIALAYSALCHSAGIESMVVRGSVN
ncbi:MAG: hypothetical protein RSB39_07035, partial [Oscillospiraceae bacterium]